jgi:hypothetical protein
MPDPGFESSDFDDTFTDVDTQAKNRDKSPDEQLFIITTFGVIAFKLVGSAVAPAAQAIIFAVDV